VYPLLKNDEARAAWIDDISKTMRSLAEEHRAELHECYVAGLFPRDLYGELGRLGYLGVFAPHEVGGLGLGVPEYAVIGEEAARTGMVSGQVAAQGIRWLLDWGTELQREQWLAGIVSGECVFSESISEKNAGSSFKRMGATARRHGPDWMLNGAKIHVNMGAQSDVTLFYAMSEDGLTSFLVDTSLPGVLRRQTEPIGLRLIPTADMFFDDVRVPDTALLGTSGGGMQTFLSTFNVSRLGNASELIGLGSRALELGLDYGRDREVGTSVVTDFQGIQWAFADAWLQLQAASFARDNALLAYERGDDVALATSTAKLLATQAAELASAASFSLVGGHGLYQDTADGAFGEILNDIKVLRVAGGSAEVLRNFVARCILRDKSYLGLR
jgi:alkylation response protein AidB-like acyl-CoA dehydrogenase